MAGETPITLIGNLTRDPELRVTPSNISVAKFAVASTPRTMKDGKWTDGDTLYLECTVWRQLAENVAESLRKGNRVVVTGFLQQRSYEKDGEKRTVYELQASEVGAALTFATAVVTKAGGGAKTSGGTPDPWATATPAGGGNFDDEPPF